jgi:hypothetical protein
MRTLILFIAIAASAAAQETRKEIVNAAPTPEGDSHSNSDKIPDVYAIPGQFDRILVLRFKYKADLLAGMEKIVKDEKIKNAVILSGAGGVRGYHVHQISNRDFPSKNMFVKKSYSAGRFDQHERIHYRRQDSRAHDTGDSR